MTHQSTIDSTAFVNGALRNIRSYSKSHYRLIQEGFNVLPETYYNWGHITELHPEMRQFYSNEAIMALSHFTSGGIIKPWFEHAQSSAHKELMSWSVPLLDIYSNRSCISNRVSDSHDDFIDQNDEWKYYSITKLKELQSSIGLEALLFPEECEEDAEHICFLRCSRNVIQILGGFIHNDVGKVNIPIDHRFYLCKNALFFRFINSVMDYIHLPQRKRIIQELALYIQNNVASRRLMDMGSLTKQLPDVMSDFKTLDGFDTLIHQRHLSCSPVVCS
jgi:hypothetical protein